LGVWGLRGLGWRLQLSEVARGSGIPPLGASVQACKAATRVGHVRANHETPGGSDASFQGIGYRV